jgi:hypothetical protein
MVFAKWTGYQSPNAAQCERCSLGVISVRRLSALVCTLVACFVVPATAYAFIALTSAGGFNWDFAVPGDFLPSGAMSDGTSDAYDGCYTLRVAGTAYQPVGTATTTMAGRQIEYPTQALSGLTVQRIVYVPAADHNYARYLEIFSNPSGAPITVTITVDGNLGSDGGTIITGSSSGDSAFSTADQWLTTDDFDGGGDPSLAHVVQGSGPAVPTSASSISFDNIAYSWSLTVPAGGRAAIMHFAVQERTAALAQTEARRLLEVPDDVLVGIDTYLPDIVNFPVLFPCATADGTACTTPSGLGGLCYTGACCTGCWDGTRCRAGNAPAQCGVRGGSCATCVDGDQCTNDVCLAGVCSNPNSGTRCDDGLYCTPTDTCNGSGRCLGTGATCNDFEVCTTDSCNEATDSCTNAPRPESTACTTDGFSGFCRSGACCVGCWNGTSCQSGFSAAACGQGGVACASCIDGDLCTRDVCTLGVCSNPDAAMGTRCDDGQFCTATDTCDASGNCNGTGARCDDRATCTTDSCDEAADRCVYMPDAVSCSIGGACVAAGTVNPSYPCLVCDPTRSGTDWTPLAVGTECGDSSCAAGRLTMRACNEVGFCVASEPVACPSGKCAGSRRCDPVCAPGDCEEGFYCDSIAMRCLAIGADGDECHDAAGCSSGNCVDGVCCAGACDGPCERCSEGTGTCDAVGRGLDPDDECTLECDGERACVIPDDAGVDAGGPSDGGATAADGSVMLADAGTTPPEEDDGCGCRATGESGWSSMVPALLALLAIRRRRRR